jgi:hypothetical protein
MYALTNKLSILFGSFVSCDCSGETFALIDRKGFSNGIIKSRKYSSITSDIRGVNLFCIGVSRITEREVDFKSRCRMVGK